MDMCVDLWAWTGRGPCPEPPAGFVAWVAEDPSWARDRAPNDLVLRAAVASAGGVALSGAWAFAGAIRGRAILEYRPAGPAPALATDADPALLPAAAFLLDRASEVAATGVPWWTAWRQAAAALCETYEGCGFELAW
ncbi:MAG TPA: hypothetical protein VNM16_10480, partial [Bacillota bacterium]|nr:hypothetical protein [Bacillota bacterium]